MKHLLLLLPILLLAAAAGAAADRGPDGGPDADLTSTYAALRPALAQSPFGIPLILESREEDGRVTGEIHALVDHPFARLGAALATPEAWCEVLFLHLNVKRCTVPAGEEQPELKVGLGRKGKPADSHTYDLGFRFRLAEHSARSFRVVLTQEGGSPDGDGCQLSLDAVPVGSGKTFARMAYSCQYGVAARLAMNTYLATLGKDKVGFTVVSRDADGSPVYTGGLRGALERNTMRYYLAMDTYLESFHQPPARRPRWRLEAWFAATERYAPQLHELPREDYLRLKAAGPAGGAEGGAD